MEIFITLRDYFNNEVRNIILIKSYYFEERMESGRAQSKRNGAGGGHFY